MSELAYENCYGVINNHIIGKSTVDNRNLALVYDPDSVWGYSVEGHGYCIHGMKYYKANQATGITGSWDATKWTQTKVGDELSANKLGGSVTITDYTSSNMFTCPNDGFVEARAASQNSYITISIVGADGDTTKRMDYTINAPTSYEMDSLFTVKKGMKLYIAAKSGSASALYNPLV